MVVLASAALVPELVRAYLRKAGHATVMNLVKIYMVVGFFVPKRRKKL